jgi:hypothetical protein
MTTGSATNVKEVSKEFILKWVWDRITPKTMYGDIEAIDQKVYDTLKKMFSEGEPKKMIPKKVWDIDAEWDHLGRDISRVLRNKFMEAAGIGGEKGAEIFAKEATEYIHRLKMGVTDSIDCVRGIEKRGEPADSL